MARLLRRSSWRKSGQRQSGKFNLMKILLNCPRQCLRRSGVPWHSATEKRRTHRNSVTNQGRTTTDFPAYVLKIESEPPKMPLHGKIPSNGISLSPLHPAQRGILICRSFLHNILQNRALLLRQLLIPDL